MSALPEYKGSPQVWTLVYVFYINNSCIGLHSGWSVDRIVPVLFFVTRQAFIIKTTGNKSSRYQCKASIVENIWYILQYIESIITTAVDINNEIMYKKQRYNIASIG